MKNKRGFTLMEMAITIAVGAILMTSLGMLAQAQYGAMVENRNYIIAYNLARDRMASLSNLDYPAVSAETGLTPDSDFPGFIPTQEVTQLDTSGAHSLRQVCLRKRLGSVTGPVLVTLYTYRSDLLTFGDGV